jgi:hypothetical protein
VAAALAQALAHRAGEEPQPVRAARNTVARLTSLAHSRDLSPLHRDCLDAARRVIARWETGSAG